MISIEEFAEQLLRIGAGHQPRPFPRRRRDREILMKSFVMTLSCGADATYTESEVNERIGSWLREVAPALQVDHVTVRRHLIDYGMLERTRDGGRYRIGFPARPLAFDLEVEDLDVRATVAAYREAHPRRRSPPKASDDGSG